MARSKKGLQTGDLDAAIELGIRHATVNIFLNRYVVTFEGSPQPADTEVAPGFALSEEKLAEMDSKVRKGNDAGVELYFIILTQDAGNKAINEMLLDPRHTKGNLYAFRVLDEPGQQFFSNIMSVLASRYAPGSPNGYVRQWIVGNEVNCHGVWYNLGGASIEKMIEAYEMAVRLVYQAVSAVDPDGRIYISLEHHWGSAHSRNPLQSCRGRDVVDAFAAYAKERGDFPWHLAYHPYPQNLFNCRFWEDGQAQNRVDTRKITFKNIQILTDYMSRDELLWQGATRRVILSEQGFHCRNDPTGEHDQACAFALAWQKVQENDSIDAFILRSHVDHAREGGLNLGICEKAPGTINDVGRKRIVWDLFRLCDTPEGPEKLEPYIAATKTCQEKELPPDQLTRFTKQIGTCIAEQGTSSTASLHLLSDRRVLQIKRKGGGSGKTEVHVTNGRYNGWDVHNATPLPETDNSYQFDVDKTSDDLYCFKMVKDEKMQVFVLDARSHYKQMKLHTETSLEGVDPSMCSVHLGPSQDIYVLKTELTESETIKVQILSKSSEYKELATDVPSALQASEQSSGCFKVDQNSGDVVFFKQSGTNSESVELHIMRAPKYDAFLFQAPTCVEEVDANYQFDIYDEGYCAFRMSGGSTKSTELHMFTIRVPF